MKDLGTLIFAIVVISQFIIPAIVAKKKKTAARKALLDAENPIQQAQSNAQTNPPRRGLKAMIDEVKAKAAAAANPPKRRATPRPPQQAVPVVVRRETPVEKSLELDPYARHERVGSRFESPAPTSAKKLRSMLRSRSKLGELMLLREVLGPPVALRAPQHDED